jgi:hypothetical protein
MSGTSAVSSQAVPSGGYRNFKELPAEVCQLSVTVALPVGGTSAFSHRTAPRRGESARSDAGAPIDGVTLSCGLSVRDNLGTPSGGESVIPFQFVLLRVLGPMLMTR